MLPLLKRDALRMATDLCQETGGDYVFDKRAMPHGAGAPVGGTTLARESEKTDPGEWVMRDRDVRAAMLQALEAAHAGDDDTCLIQEMDVWSGTVRIDIAVVNGELCGFELKSDRDTLERLPYQADIYSRVFDRVTLVVGERHARKARKIIPKWWGVTIARLQGGSIRLVQDRSAKLNPGPDPLLIAELLSKTEVVETLGRLGLAKGWRSKSAAQVRERLACALPLPDLKEQVRATIKARLGYDHACSFEVAVNAVPDPDRQASGREGVCCDLVNTAIGPAMRESAAGAIANDTRRVGPKLGAHLDRPGPRRAHASTHQKLGLKRVAGGDGEPPSNS